jgi:hypothetical protein
MTPCLCAQFNAPHSNRDPNRFLDGKLLLTRQPSAERFALDVGMT